MPRTRPASTPAKYSTGEEEEFSGIKGCNIASARRGVFSGGGRVPVVNALFFFVQEGDVAHPYGLYPFILLEPSQQFYSFKLKMDRIAPSP